MDEDLNADIEQGHLSSALCHLGNVSYRLGETISAADMQKQLDGDDEALKTFERVTNHLQENNVDLAQAQLRGGAQLTLDGKKEIFTGDLAKIATPHLTRV